MISCSCEMKLQIYNKKQWQIKRKINYIKQGIYLSPLSNTPSIQCRLYGYDTIAQGTVFFETMEEFLEYASQDSFPKTSLVDFIGDFEGQTDVIRIATLKDVFYVTAFDECHIWMYDYEESKKQNQSVWKDYVGYLKEEYEAFQKTGIVLQKNIYNNSKATHETGKTYIKENK